MSKFTFICQEEAMPFSDVVSSKRTVEFNADSLNQIVSEFEHFLRGCGFFFEGQLDFVNDEDCQLEERIQFDFSDIPQNNWPFGSFKPQSVCDSEKTSER
jgi:hypothetical protein